MLVQLVPIRVMHPLGPHLFNDGRHRAVAGGQRHLNVEFQVPLRIAKSVFLARILLDFHQQDNVLFEHLGRRELGNITFDKLPRL